jgi:hypothetical protein
MMSLVKSFRYIDKVSVKAIDGCEKTTKSHRQVYFPRTVQHASNVTGTCTVVPNDDARHVGQHQVGTTHAYLPLSKAGLQSRDLSQSLDLKTVRCSTVPNKVSFPCSPSPSPAENQWGVV